MHRPLLAGLTLVTAVLVSAASCSIAHLASVTDSDGSSGQGGASAIGPTSSTTSAGFAGGGGSGASGGSCAKDDECPANGNPCEAPACVMKQCVVTPVVAGTPTPSQVKGDCLEVQCDGTGKTQTIPIVDPPDDGNECTTGYCSDGTPSSVNLNAGASCQQGGGTVCDAKAHCVQCVSQADCNSGVCEDWLCVPETCKDTALDGNESAVDCGGSCVPCADGLACKLPSDCKSKVCDSGKCKPPACNDGVKNGEESDKDCGGPCPNRCADGRSCALPADCANGVCSEGVCQAASCTDAVKNGKETDIDCGGGCKECPNFFACVKNSDCVSRTCIGEKCYLATCHNGARDHDESDTDCGGGNCPPCALGKQCNCHLDCSSIGCCSGKCANPNACQLDTCTN